jgi:hypothetical protein
VLRSIRYWRRRTSRWIRQPVAAFYKRRRSGNLENRRRS